MQQQLPRLQQLFDMLLVAQRQRPVPQSRLMLAQSARQRNGVVDIGERIVGAIDRESVGPRQVLESEARLTVVAARPLDAARTQRMGQAEQIDQVEPGVAVAKFTRVGVDEVAPEQEPGDLVVEAEAVVTDRTGAGAAHQFEYALGKLVFGQAALTRQLRRDSGDQAGIRCRQHIGCRLAVNDHRLANWRQLQIGAHSGELAGAILTRIGAEGFVVVPQEAVCIHAFIVPPLRVVVLRFCRSQVLRMRGLILPV